MQMLTHNPYDRRAQDEVFLFHLSRGSQLLMEDKFGEAKVDLEKALALQPKDAKGQALLAIVYFRLGHYPRAISIYQNLVRDFPEDVALRINLALAFLKSGQASSAMIHIRAALDLDPEHDRAWAYLGIIYWRLGDYAAARDAFARSDQPAMVRRIDEVLSPETLSRNEDSQQLATRRNSTLVRMAAAQAIEHFESKIMPLSLAPNTQRRLSGRWQVTEPGASSGFSQYPRRSSMPPPDTKSLSEHLVGWKPKITQEPFCLLPTGQLWIRSQTPIVTRVADALFMVERPTQPSHISKDFSQLSVDELGRYLELAYPCAPSNQNYWILSLLDDVLFVKSEWLWSWEAALNAEICPILETNPEATAIKIQGTGQVVLRTPKNPLTYHVLPSERVKVALKSILGWTGRLYPIESLPDANDVHLIFAGEGILLLVS